MWRSLSFFFTTFCQVLEVCYLKKKQIEFMALASYIFGFLLNSRIAECETTSHQEKKEYNIFSETLSLLFYSRFSLHDKYYIIPRRLYAFSSLIDSSKCSTTSSVKSKSFFSPIFSLSFLTFPGNAFLV